MSKFTKATKGPWVARFVPNGAIKYWAIIGAQSNGFEIVVATVNAEVDRDDNNAHLIAAAPDLLEACRALLKDHVITEPHHEHLCPECISAQKAIAKAEGEK